MYNLSDSEGNKDETCYNKNERFPENTGNFKEYEYS